MKRIAYTITPYTTVIRLLGVVQNPANGFPARPLGAVRYFDHEMREFSLSVPPDVYTEYEDHAECRARRQPELTQYPDYLERTKEDLSQIINRAKELHDRATDR